MEREAAQHDRSPGAMVMNVRSEARESTRSSRPGSRWTDSGGSPSWAIAAALTACVTAPLAAQGVGETTGSLFGRIRDSAGAPLVAVEVTLRGPTGDRTASSDEDGNFVYPFLAPGSYSLRTEIAGFQPIEDTEVAIRLDARTEVELTMYPLFQEAVEVSGAVPLVDPASTTIGVNVDDQWIQSLPLSRSFTSIINLAPGVADAGVGGNLSISGASGLENTYIVDGVNITDPGYGAIGAYSRKFGSMGSGFPPDMIEEVQIRTGGFEPEYGQALGGVVNVITRSGSNLFSGQVFAYYGPGSLAGDPTAVDLEANLWVNEEARESVDGGIHLSGPILRDRLFFFAAYNPRREKLNYRNDPEAPRASEFATETNVRRTDAYALKLTAAPSSRHTLELSSFGDPSHADLGNQTGFGLASLDPEATRSSLDYGSESSVARWSGVLSSRTFVEATYARAHDTFQEILGPQGDQNRVTDRTVSPVVRSGGIGGFDAGSDGTNSQYGVKLTHLFGDHEIRYGAQLEEIEYLGGSDISGPSFRASDGRSTSGGAFVTVLAGEAGGYPFEKYYQAFGWLSPARRPSSTEYLSAFAQDYWSVTPSLTLLLGLRWEEQQLRADLAGSQNVTFRDNWGPRVGLTWDYRRDGSSKAFFHYGRFFEKIPNDLAVRTLSAEAAVFGHFYDAALTQPIPGSEVIFEGTGTEIEGLGNSTSPFTTRAQYSDEWVLGVEQLIGQRLLVGARGIYRSVGRVLEDITVDLDAPCVPDYRGTDLCVPPAVRAEDYLTANLGGLITNLDGHYPGTPELTREYRAVELTAETRFHGSWQMFGSYRYARLEGNYEGLFRRDNGQSDPNITSLADVGISPWIAYTFVEGPLPNDVEHALKLFGIYRWSRGLNAALAAYYSSGRPITELGAVPTYGGYSRVLSPRGSFGRTDSITTLDLRIDYAFRLGSDARTLALGFDVFNLLDARAITRVDESSEFDTFTYQPEPNPDFLAPIAYQTPRTIRLFVRYSF